MRQLASGPDGPGGTGSSPRSSASSRGAFQQSLAGRSPVLDAAQLEVLRKYGSEHDMAAGEVLFADGDRSYDLIVVLAGEARIIERRSQPGERVIATYGPSQFLGEIGMLTGQRAYLSAQAATAGRVLRVPVEQVRVIMAQELGLSELILRTFLLRHSILTGRGSGLTLIGSRLMPAPGACWRSWLVTGWRRGGWSWKDHLKSRRCSGSWMCPSPTCRSSSYLAARC
jgi:CRP-like cAMP-binding protein